MTSPRCRVSLTLVAAAVLLGGCVTHIKTEITQNHAPAENFAGFTRFELAKVALVAPYAGQDANEHALVKIQENVSLKADPLLQGWNAAGATVTPVRTLVITPVVTEIKFIRVGVRLLAGALPGSSAVILRVTFTEKETGQVIASPLFYARAAAMGGRWTFGTTDNLMLVRIADRFTDYLAANYSAAVGGPTGAEPRK
jgi:hypothetical protein